MEPDKNKSKQIKRRSNKSSDVVVAAGVIVFIAALAGFISLPNYLWNNGMDMEKGCTTYSYSIWPWGHVEYTEFKDGTFSIKEYPSLGHRSLDSVYYEDLDGDGKIDRIRESGPEWKANSYQRTLVREYDYMDFKGEFEAADRLLAELKQKYN